MIGVINDYDLSGSMIFRNNIVTNLTSNYAGIELWWHEETNSHVLITQNTFTGRGWAGIYIEGFEDQIANVDILDNMIDGVQSGVWVDWVSYGSGLTTLTIYDNDITEVTWTGIYIYEVWQSFSTINIEMNLITGSILTYYSVSLIFFDGHTNGASWTGAFAEINIVDNTLLNGQHGVYFDGTNGNGATVVVEIDPTTVTNTLYGIFLNQPVWSAVDVLSIKISDTSFTDCQRGFFYISNKGLGQLLVDISNVNVMNYGAMGGYAFYVGNNNGGFLQIDVRGSNFVRASTALGDVYAGPGSPIFMNFYFNPDLSTGVSLSWNHRIRTLWKVDVKVLVGQNLDQPGTSGIVVGSTDQFNNLDFNAVTDPNGEVNDLWISGIVWVPGYTGVAVHTFQAQLGGVGGFLAQTMAAFSANGTVTILLPGDADADGLHDNIDVDDDNDGIPDANDAFPFDPSENWDTDNDGIGDNSDLDDDNDGVPDFLDAFALFWGEWHDIDGDGVGDNTDDDSDNDGVPDGVDAF
ncbi:MAG: right-handed parallel beta-helix repeat-containing protein, partial [Gammaproteobacteria bacterium]|nr:right-handed parallel beta-helix repeat-containing protein [Gammaproteobacteria bacterium]